MNFFEQELHKIIDKTGYRWQYIGRSAYLRAGSMVIRVHFSTTGIADTYEALSFDAITINGAKIDSILVMFSDFLGRKLRTVNYGKGYQWESVPTNAEYKSMTEQLEKYIDVFC